MGDLLKLSALILRDSKVQYRSGMYLIYSVIIAIYIFGLRHIPADKRDLWTLLVVYSDISTIGALYFGAMIFMEKSNNLDMDFFITPTPLAYYIYSKIFTLTLISLVSSVVIIVFTNTTESFITISVLLGVILTSIFSTLFSLLFIHKLNSLTNLLIWVTLLSIFFSIPIIAYFDIMPFYVIALHPMTFDVMLISMSSISPIYCITGFLYQVSVIYYLYVKVKQRVAYV